ncbi:complement factor B [Notechis scutatus]|uniref:Complement factor B n=1 Tax=Notechis scutatus TaxID=8663 RepID=A0A6J1VQ43_9SAUR|nr:complement factor B [Notechis scutatus]
MVKDQMVASLHSASFLGTVDGACDPKAAEILGGNYTLLEDGTALTYKCPQGQYPHPTQFRFCKNGNQWSLLTDREGRTVEKAECRAIRCVRPLEFENGVFEIFQQFYEINQELKFTCYDGHKLRGPQIRTCLPTGKWSGETAVCDDGTGHCPDPGIPIGARKYGTEYKPGSTVRYQCSRGLSLIGSKERVCQKSGIWSGSEPECRSPFTFDSKEEITTKFLPSLIEVALSASQGAPANKSDSLNIYFLLDASESFGRKRFIKAKEALVKLIQKLSSYDILPNYGIVTFATESRMVLRTTHPQSSDADWVSERLGSISIDAHELKPGTNIANGLQFVYEMMIMQDMEEKRRGLNPTPVSTTARHIIILLTDGNYNLGGPPFLIIQQIKEFLNIGRPSENPRDDHLDLYNVGSSSSATLLQIDIAESSPNPRDDRLDVYVFGNGHNINTEAINELASHKPNERHGFILKDLDELKEVLEKSLDDGESLPMCGFSPGEEAVNDYEKYPWFARIVINELRQEICKGVIVSDQDILTAAHCLAGVNGIEDISVILGTTNFAVAEIRRHPEYNSQKVKNKRTPEFYDYDVALVKLKEKQLPSFARPVCLPCTIETTRILRKPHPQTTCKDHEEELLYDGNIHSLFITPCEYSSGQKSGLLQRNVWIKNGEKKMACNLDAEKAKRYEKVANISEMVSEHFLCTGGTDPQVDPNVCSNDSGGPLLIQRRLRYVQLGVISWSVVDTCEFDRSLLCDSEPVKKSPPHARDFHINIFKILPWLKEQLGTEVEFL